MLSLQRRAILAVSLRQRLAVLLLPLRQLHEQLLRAKQLDRQRLEPELVYAHVNSNSQIPLHGPDRTQPDRTRPDKVRGLCFVLAKFHYTDPHVSK